MPEPLDPKTAAAQQQVEQLESEKAQILQRAQKAAARLEIIEAQLKALRPLTGQ